MSTNTLHKGDDDDNNNNNNNNNNNMRVCFRSVKLFLMQSSGR